MRPGILTLPPSPESSVRAAEGLRAVMTSSCPSRNSCLSEHPSKMHFPKDSLRGQTKNHTRVEVSYLRGLMGRGGRNQGHVLRQPAENLERRITLNASSAERSRVQGSGLRIWGSGFQVSGFGFWISGLGFWVSGVGFGISGIGFTPKIRKSAP